MVMNTSSPNMTSQLPNVRFQSRRGHFWFVFVKLLETVGFSYLEHHSLCKTKFWELILLPVGMTYVFEKDFQQKKKLSQFRCIWPLILVSGQISSPHTWSKTIFIFFSARERVEFKKSCNLIGSGSGRNFQSGPLQRADRVDLFSWMN